MFPLKRTPRHGYPPERPSTGRCRRAGCAHPCGTDGPGLQGGSGLRRAGNAHRGRMVGRGRSGDDGRDPGHRTVVGTAQRSPADRPDSAFRADQPGPAYQRGPGGRGSGPSRDRQGRPLSEPGPRGDVLLHPTLGQQPRRAAHHRHRRRQRPGGAVEHRGHVGLGARPLRACPAQYRSGRRPAHGGHRRLPGRPGEPLRRGRAELRRRALAAASIGLRPIQRRRPERESSPDPGPLRRRADVGAGRGPGRTEPGPDRIHHPDPGVEPERLAEPPGGPAR